MVKRIIFVYNADSGRLAGLVDSLKKAVRSSRACSLCRITHGLVRKKDAWQRVEETLGGVVEYYHRDDMPDGIGAWITEKALPLPVVLFEVEDGELREGVDADALNGCGGAAGCLESALRSALAAVV